jgi:hypothetical protein
MSANISAGHQCASFALARCKTVCQSDKVSSAIKLRPNSGDHGGAIVLCYIYVNGTNVGFGHYGSTLIASKLQPHTTYSIQFQQQNIRDNAQSDLSAPLSVTTLGLGPAEK